MLWEIDIHPAEGQPDRAAERLVSTARELGLAKELTAATARGFLIQGESLERAAVEKLANDLLTDTVVERAVVGRVGVCEDTETGTQGEKEHQVTVLLKPGVMGPVAQSALAAAADLGVYPDAFATVRKYWLTGASQEEIKSLGERLLANDAIEHVYFGPLALGRLELGQLYQFELRTTAIRDLDDAGLMQLSREGQLYLQLAEMQTIRQQFGALGANQQTWN